MPMPYENFNWRPNDNSAKTNLRYSLEAEKWVNAVSSARRKNKSRSMVKDFLFIGMVIQLIFSVILLILYAVLKLTSLLVKLVEKSLRGNGNSEKSMEKEQLNPFGKDVEETDPSFEVQETKYPKGWQLIFWNRWGRLRYFWQFIYLLVFIFVIEMMVLFFLNQYFPEYVKINRDVMLIAGAVSLWNAFVGVGEY